MQFDPFPVFRAFLKGCRVMSGFPTATCIIKQSTNQTGTKTLGSNLILSSLHAYLKVSAEKVIDCSMHDIVVSSIFPPDLMHYQNRQND